MRARGAGAGGLILFSVLALSTALSVDPAQANTSNRTGAATQHAKASSATGHTTRVAMHGRSAGHGRQYARSGGISCVPFARADSGIEVAGNAWQWWDNAAGTYARGSVPEPGAVLTFRSNGRMRLGHVAVVSRVINAREIEIDHANWWGPGMRGGVAHNMPVVDVSENNDWTAVRVGLGDSGAFGSVYPTYGFIYDRPDNGRMLVATSAPAPQPELNPAPRDLRPATERGWQGFEEEVAEAPLKPGKKYRHTTGTTLASHRVGATTASVTQVSHRTSAGTTQVAHRGSTATYYR